jgi:hypothetical protein
LEITCILGCHQYRKVGTALDQTIPHPQEMRNHGIQARVATIISRGLKATVDAPEEVFEGTRGRGIAKLTPLKADLTYLKYPIKILNQKSHVTRHKMIKFFKV